jgi:hypothetical protein
MATPLLSVEEQQRALAQLYQLAVDKSDFRAVRDQKSESDQRSQSANPL